MLELVIGMVISSLVITMVYFIYDNLSRQVIVYGQQQDQLMEYTMFQSLFSKDIKLSKTFEVIDDHNIAIEVLDEDVHYFFQKERIIRKGIALDTFNIKVLKISFDQNEKIEEKYKLIKLKTEVLGATFDVFESKEISLAKRMNTYLLDEH